MSKQIEVSLRIPNAKVRPLDENGYPIDHASVRFKKVIEVESIPRPGDSLTLPTASGRLLPSSVVSANWHDGMEMFVVAFSADRSADSMNHAFKYNEQELRAWRTHGRFGGPGTLWVPLQTSRRAATA